VRVTVELITSIDRYLCFPLFNFLVGHSFLSFVLRLLFRRAELPPKIIGVIHLPIHKELQIQTNTHTPAMPNIASKKIPTANSGAINSPNPK
jgi:hypothetical protein